MKATLRILIVVCLFAVSLLGACRSTVVYSDIPTSFAATVDKITPSVVYIVAQGLSTSSGSGVIMHRDGYILTNRHVVEGSLTVVVTLQDRSSFTATNVWMDDLTDLAVIKIDPAQYAKGFTAAEFGDPLSINVGDWVVAVGHPLGLSPSDGGATVTAGIVSNLGRSFIIENINYYDVIQTDAAINPGNSGGPLVNLEGQVIGINSAISASGQNIGFAINVNTAEFVFNGLMNYGKVQRAFLGVVMTDVSYDSSFALSPEAKSGALITNVVPGSPAAIGGLQVNDVIVAINGQTINGVAQLVTKLWQYQVGTTVTLDVYRGNNLIYIQATLVERPD